MITRAQVEKSAMDYVFHGNMGYVDDGDQSSDRHKGFVYGYQCHEYPRYQLRQIHHTLDDGRWVTEYFVDGEQVKDLDEVVERLNKPVQLTAEERKVLALIPNAPTDLRLIEDMIAGCERPGSVIMPNSPHSYAFKMLDQLRSKGVVRLGKREWDNLPEDHDDEQMMPKHLRFDPTIMRVV